MAEIFMSYLECLSFVLFVIICVEVECAVIGILYALFGHNSEIIRCCWRAVCGVHRAIYRKITSKLHKAITMPIERNDIKTAA